MGDLPVLYMHGLWFYRGQTPKLCEKLCCCSCQDRDAEDLLYCKRLGGLSVRLPGFRERAAESRDTLIRDLYQLNH